MSEIENNSGTSIHVMVVDDSKVQRQFTMDLCVERGWSVADTACDGMEALLKVKQMGAVQLDLLLLDLEMPGLNGIDLLQEFARIQFKTPIVILSSRELNLLESVASMAQQSGLNIIQVAQKPLRAAVLDGLDIGKKTFSEQTPDVTLSELIAAIPQFQTFYTPSISLETGVIHQMVARLAWPHPRLGLLSPHQCALEILDENDYLRAMVRHQKQVLTQAQQWSACGLNFALQLELPLRNMQTALQARLLLNEVQQHGLTESKITFLIVINADKALALAGSVSALNLLRIQNIGLALSEKSLNFDWVSNIRKVPFNQLVLSADQVKRRESDSLMPTLCKHNIALAHDLNMTVHAEGLSTLEDWVYLQQRNCDTAQGQLIGPALSADEVSLWLKEHQGELKLKAEQCKVSP